ncbi:O-antigen ligase family protein [Celeribacter marinus]|uniref:O-antigen ligase-related domain-containing protein n=1 Tax=Celeribacter marinus TaxID=1397108 RepID=A0A0N9ZEF8_9RHOB|nr:O-antigen ligase family protein [Celeribacter marinus]ALI53967.1 hypothetical protein IMCC12053_17 [Celeribacter marinus]SFL02963.1 O-antigen ligase [Celeribacter marinus]
MRLTYAGFTTAILVLSVSGYPLTAGITTVLGLDNRMASVLMRAVVLLLTVLVLLRPGSTSALRPSWPILLFFLFWTIYLVRMAYDTILGTGELGRPALDYWLFGVGTSFLPASALLLTRSLPKPRGLVRWTLWTSVAALLLGLVFGQASMISSNGASFDTGRLSLESLNPISLGHVGATVFLIAYWKLRHDRVSLVTTLAYLATAGFGLVGIGMSGSRGPFIAALASVLFIEASKGGRAIIWKATILLVPLLSLSVDLTALDKFFGINLFDRLDAAIQLTDPSALGRNAQYASAWRMFLDHPVLGATLEDPAFRIYPHNIVLEALMATGFIGTAFLLGFLLSVLFRAFTLATKNSEYAAFSALYVQHFVAGQFSSSLYLVNTMWAIAALLAAISIYSTTTAREARLEAHAYRPRRAKRMTH